VWSVGGVVNETVGEVSVVVLIDRRTRAATAFRRTIDDRTLKFTPAEGVGVARDRETGSIWRIDGLAISAPLEGRQLRPVTFHVGAWSSWVAYFRDTSVYRRELR
jgi:hypothetical protein